MKQKTWRKIWQRTTTTPCNALLTLLTLCPVYLGFTQTFLTQYATLTMPPSTNLTNLIPVTMVALVTQFPWLRMRAKDVICALLIISTPTRNFKLFSCPLWRHQMVRSVDFPLSMLLSFVAPSFGLIRNLIVCDLKWFIWLIPWGAFTLYYGDAKMCKRERVT